MSRLIKCKYTVKCEALKPVYEYMETYLASLYYNALEVIQ